MLCLDLDNFKIVNDTLGHRVGDQLLEAGRAAPRRGRRRGRFLARTGGDEFCLLVDGDAPRPHERSRRAASTARPAASIVDGHYVRAGASIGIADRAGRRARSPTT